MGTNPLLGVFLHWLGGLASASFYVPYRQVRGWSWETYWLAGGVVSWIVAPWVMAGLLTHDLLSVLHDSPGSAIFWAYFFGVLWGLGGLTFGLTMRYLGLSLGMAVALGYTAVFGTLIPPIFHGQFMQLLTQRSGIIILVGVGICVLGIVFAGAAKHVEGEGTLTRAEACEYSRVQPEARARSSDFLWRYEFLFCIWTRCWKSYQGSHAASWDEHYVAGVTSACRCACRWIHDQFYMVRSTEQAEPQLS